ncbi:MAG: DNA-methyltransferase [Thermoproteota archaeon]
MFELNRVICGNALEVLKTFPDEVVDCIITSPPYYGKRKYGKDAELIWDGDKNCEHEWNEQNFCKKCGAWRGELGLEPSPSLYVQHLLQITAELKRVLKKTGTFFLNVNDTYSQVSENGMRQKSMVLVPERLLFGLYEQGWYIRNKIVWLKPNAMPESVKSRFSNRYEFVYFLTKSKHYYFDLDSIRLPHKSKEAMEEYYKMDALSKAKKFRRRDTPFQVMTNEAPHRREKLTKHDVAVGRIGKYSYADPLHAKPYSPKGKNPGDVFDERELSASKFFTTSVRTASPGARALLAVKSGKLTTRVRRKLYDVGAYLKKKLKESPFSVEDLSRLTGIKQTTLEHYFRTDLSGQALPDKLTWDLLKPLLNLDSYEKFVSEEIKSALPQPHPLGKNPGDVLELSTEPFGREFCPNCKRFLKRSELKMKDGLLVCGYCGSKLVSHFAVFPRKLVAPLITAGCPEGGVVLDPFCGSGTALVVAKELGRSYVGIDVVRTYCDMAEVRLKEVRVEKKLLNYTKTE